MHYYQFNIGDYAKSTLHLSLMEDLAYRRLLDRYYDTEKPLETDLTKLCRFIRMGSYETETQQILDEFFSLTQKGWIQKRVQKELGAYSAKADAARANGKLGGRPKKTQSVNSANPELTQTKAKQEPLNTNHKPLNNKYSTDDYSLSVAMYELIINIAPHTKKPDFEKWANIIRLMREVDKIPLATIQQVFNWANSDDFWKTNILSASKLRKQFNQLQAKMVNTNENNQRPNQPRRSSVVDRAHAAADERERARQARTDDGQVMAEVAGGVRSSAQQSVRGDDTRELGTTLDGTYRRTD